MKTLNSDEKYNINISIDRKSIQLCIDDKFYKIVNSSTSIDEFQMIGMQIMDMIDALDDILRFREVKVNRLDDVMKRKMTAFSQLLAVSVLPKREETQLEKLVQTKAAQQTFKSIAMRHEDIETKNVGRTLSECIKDKEERLHPKKEVDYTDDAQLEAAVQKLYGDKKPEKQPVDIVKNLKLNVKKTEVEKVEKSVKKAVEPVKEENAKTIAETIQENTKKEYTFDQQYLIDTYIKHFGKVKVSRDKFKQEVRTNRYVKLFGDYTKYVTAVLS